MNQSDAVLLAKITKAKQPVAVDVFCGVGGLTYGLQTAGLRVVAGIDFDESCRFAYEENNRARFLHQDITKVSAAEVAALYPPDALRILVGCAPCQPFSRVPGERVDKDEKWKLLYSFGDLIEKVAPEVVSMENVTLLAGYEKGKVLNDFICKLEGLGYYVSKFVVNAANYGVPQRRYRLILFASKFGKIRLVTKTHVGSQLPSVADAIKGLPALEAGQADATDPLHRARSLSSINMRRIQATPEGGDWTAWPEELAADLTCRKSIVGKSFTSAYGRMSWKEPAPTLTTHCTGLSNGRYGHPEQHRAISLREAALLQSFPSDYHFIKKDEQGIISTLARHIGNAVPPKLGEAIAHSILQHLANPTTANNNGRQVKMAF
ncbi:DNA cytosine methyltransferase [uncultured Hymenobacter sp.]|uniref:DNA cytosine methyltransferase n=1 Tax=uncultured Hymenobacter sp. TaxID=170016 RepID=UPI0035CBCE0D